MSKPIIPITIAYLAGLISGSIFNYFPITVITAIIVLIIIDIVFYKFNPPHLPFLFLIFLFGLFYYQLLSAPPAYNDISRYIDKDKITIEGIVYRPPDEYKRKTVAYIKAQKVYVKDRAKKVTGRIRLSIYNSTSPPFNFPLSKGGYRGVKEETEGLLEKEARLRYGDIIRFEAKLKMPRSFWNPGGFDYEVYLARQGIYATASISDKDDIEIIGSKGNPVLKKIFNAQEKIRSAINGSLTGPPAAILLAMIIGDTTGLTDEIRDAFMASGTTHILSISGSHLGLIAVLIFFAVRFILSLLPEKLLIRITIYTTPTKIAAITTIIPVVAYTLISGAQIATVRSMIMILVFILAVLVDRGSEILNSLALSCLILLLIDPLSIHDISFQLTMVSVLFIAMAIEMRRLGRLEGEGNLHSIKDKALAYLFITIAVSLGTAPIVAYYFRQVPWVGLFANSIVVPFAGFVIVPLGLLSSIVSLFTGNIFLSGLNETLLNLFYGIVRLFSHIPYAEIHIASPGIFYLSLFYILVFLLYRQRQINYKAAAFIALMLFTLIARPLIAQINRDFKVTFLDVGQGDSAVIEFPDRKVMVIDGGGIMSETFDIGKVVIAPYLWDKGIHSIDYIVLTHPQLDHVGGLSYLLEKIRTNEVWKNKDEGNSFVYKRFENLIKGKNIQQKTQLQDMLIEANDVKVAAINNIDENQRTSINDNSVVLKISSKGYSFLFTGDIENRAQDGLVKGADLKSNVIKVPHHGGKSSFNDGFIKAVSPEFAVISVGYQNRYKHPSPEQIEAYEKIGAKIFRTDMDGAILMNISDNKINIKTYAETRLKKINLTSPFLKIIKMEGDNVRKLWR